MRRISLALLLPLGLAGCETGYLADRFGDRADVVSPQLPRFGLNEVQTRCVSDQLGRRLSFSQLRRLEINARAMRQGLSDPNRLTMNELVVAANNVGDTEVRMELDLAVRDCGVQAPTLAAVRPAATASASATPGTVQPGTVLSGPEAEALFSRPGTSTPVLPGAEAVRLTPVWLNLGAAASGQAISIDGGSVEREGETRTAWFRMIDPGTGPSLTWFQLRVNCAAQTIEPVARRKVDANGLQIEHEVYPAGYERPGQVEAGTVTEIAYLSLCT